MTIELTAFPFEFLEGEDDPSVVVLRLLKFLEVCASYLSPS
jgi:hypothetical protein